MLLLWPHGFILGPPEALALMHPAGGRAALKTSRDVYLRDAGSDSQELKIDGGLLKTAKAAVARPFARLFRRQQDVAREPICGENKYGCDPRVNAAGEDGGSGSASSEGFELVTAGMVGELTGGIAHLDALLDDAGSERAVVLKFKRDGCPACNSTIAPLASAAAAFAGRVDFVEGTWSRGRIESPCPEQPLASKRLIQHVREAPPASVPASSACLRADAMPPDVCCLQSTTTA